MRAHHQLFALLVPGALAIATGPTPLVIWHGLGDRYDSDGIKGVGDIYQNLYPNAFVHNIYLDESSSSDRSATFFGSVDTQIEHICQQLTDLPPLHNGFHALGFSQGGQFLRGYAQRCTHGPQIQTLITFGSQHNGISKFGSCKSNDWVCKSAFGLLKANTWSTYVQSHVVPAQYYRDPKDLETYLEHSGFLADMNNERQDKNATYKQNLVKVKGFVMYMFEDDETVVPKESSWFAEVLEDDDNDGDGDDGQGGANRTVTLLRDRQMYKEDWLGLKTLDDAGKIEFLTTPGAHMQISKEVLKEAFTRHLSSSNANHDEDTLRVQGPGSY